MNKYIETSEGTVGIYLDEKNQLEEGCQKWLTGIIKHRFKCRKENPISIQENPEGLFLMIHLEDETLGVPEYKIRSRWVAQTFDIQYEPNPDKVVRYDWYSWCAIQ
jgi:hypothetical protein